MRNRIKCVVSLLAAILMLTAAATGCQPNPTTPPVINKGGLEEKIKDKTAAPAASAQASDPGTAGPAATPAGPQQVTASFAGGKLAVSIDAAVQLPPVDKLPVVKVEPRKFTEAEADNIVKVLFQGKPAYKPKEKMTKSEIEQQLLEMKAMKSQAKEGDKSLEKINYLIEYYEKELLTAPETIERQVSDGKLINSEYGAELYVQTPLGKGQDANLSIYCSATGRTTSLWFTNEDPGESYMGYETAINGTPKGVTMPLDQARALAEKTVGDLGSDLKLAWSGIGVCRTKADSGKLDTNGEAWLFAFTREVNGVPTTYETDMGGNVPQEEIDQPGRGKDEFIEPHPYERMMMAINDTGILELQWTSPDSMLDTVSENAETLPLEQVMPIFEKQFFIHNALKNKSDEKPMKGEDGKPMEMEDYGKMLRDMGIYTMESIGYGEDVAKCTYTIDRVVLGLSRIAIKDKETEFMIVPVWDFFGTIAVEYTPESGFAGFTMPESNHSFLTVNAIDGSIINRSYGY